MRSVNPASFPGHLTHIDHSAAGFTFKSAHIASVSKNGNRINFSGDGLIDGTLSTTYTASGTLGGGNIQVHS